MAVAVLDEMLTMKNEVNYADVGSTIQDLETLLNMHDITHSFTLPHPVTLKECPTATAILNYCGKDHMTVSLIYALFCKIHRGLEDERIAQALVRVASHYLNDDNAE